MYNVQDYSVIYNNAVRPVTYEGWHFTHMWKTFAYLHHLTTMFGTIKLI